MFLLNVSKVDNGRMSLVKNIALQKKFKNT